MLRRSKPPVPYVRVLVFCCIALYDDIGMTMVLSRSSHLFLFLPIASNFKLMFVNLTSKFIQLCRKMKVKLFEDDWKSL